MKTYLECLPCVMRQALEGARHVVADSALAEEALRRAAHAVSAADLNVPSPVLIGAVHQMIRELLKEDDPYKAAKEICNRNALSLYPKLKRIVETSAQPLETAIRIAIAGNTIDFVVDPNADQSDLMRVVEQALEAPLSKETVTAFAQAVERAHSILYVGDNAGEIVFDRLLIEQLPAYKITYVVRGRPVINDVTMLDAQATGVSDVVEVISSGSDLPGTVLSRCSEEFRIRFSHTDLIISKGQGNFESLDETGKETFFLFKAKCVVMQLHVGCRIGELMFLHKRSA
ncbi:MAG: ARMT1-like domain-containing protein [Thermodesulfobacteriota bacterium]